MSSPFLLVFSTTTLKMLHKTSACESRFGAWLEPGANAEGELPSDTLGVFTFLWELAPPTAEGLL